jgi:hypothetical protein
MFKNKKFFGMILFLLGILCWSDSTWAAKWVKVDMGSGGLRGHGMLGVALGVGRNDAVTRVYGAEGFFPTCYISEFSYSGSNIWDKTSVGSASICWKSVVVGHGRNDGVVRLYGTSFDYKIYELSYAENIWKKEEIVSSGGRPYGITMGIGRNDNVMRFYVASASASCMTYSGHIYEYSYSESSWNSVDVGDGENTMMRVAVGIGQNDSVMRVYGANADGYIYEYTYFDDKWNKENVGSCESGMYGIAVGPGQNDGVLRVYGANGDGHIYEFTYSGSVWNKINLGSGDGCMQGVIVADGRNDGVMRVYGANYDGHIYEFTYFGGGWNKASVGSGELSINEVIVGDGRNDKVMRVYGASSDGHIYEFSYCFHIKGYVKDTNGTGIGGVTVTLSGAHSKVYTTDDDGYYEFPNLAGGNCIVTPSKTNWVFNSVSILYSPLSHDQDNQNFIGTKVIQFGNNLRGTNTLFNPAKSEMMTINWSQSESGRVSLKVYNMRGELIINLVNGDFYQAGTHEITWNGENGKGGRVASGIYIVYLKTKGFKKKIKVAVVK